jgi:NitT/TauT family transport system substrate-binding protein
MNTGLSRGAVGALLVAALGSALMQDAASAATTLVVGKAAATADPIIPVNVGDQLGIFKRHGLDLKIVDFAGGPKMIQAMTAGDIDIADGAGTEMAFIAKGVPMLAVCEVSGPFSFLSIGVPWDSPITTLKQLEGKKVGVSTAGSLTEWLMRELARSEGWGPDGITTVAIGNGTADIIAGFRAHLVDADIGVNSQFLNMEEKKIGRLLAPVSDFEGPVASGTLDASKHLIDTDPAALRAFLAAWIETVDYMRAHKAETVKIESGITGFPEAVMSKEYDLTIGMFTKGCAFDAESLVTLKRSFIDLKLVSTPPEMSTLYSEAFLPK